MCVCELTVTECPSAVAVKGVLCWPPGPSGDKFGERYKSRAGK